MPHPISRNIRLLGWFNFCADFRVYNAIAVIYFAQVSGSYALGIGVFSVAKLSSAIFELPTGVFSDYLGRKLTLALGQLASVLSIATYALGSSFTTLAAGAVLEGIAFALFSGNNDALIFETLRQDGREAQFPEYQGRLSGMYQWALAASALVAIAALNWLSYRVLFWLSVAPQFAALVLSLNLVEPRRHETGARGSVLAHLREALSGFVRDPKLRLLALASALGFALGETKFLFAPAFYATLWHGPALAVARLISHVGGALGFHFAGRAIAARGERPVLLGSSALAVSIGTVSVAMANIASPALLSISSLLFGPSVVAQQSLMQKAFSDRQRATMASFAQFAGNAFFAVAAFGLGLLADAIGPRYALLTAEGLTIGITYLYWRLFAES